MLLGLRPQDTAFNEILRTSALASKYGLHPQFHIMQIVKQAVQSKVYELSLKGVTKSFEGINVVFEPNKGSKAPKLMANNGLSGHAKLHFIGPVSFIRSSPCFFLGEVFDIPLYLSQPAAHSFHSENPCPAWMVKLGHPAIANMAVDLEYVNLVIKKDLSDATVMKLNEKVQDTEVVISLRLPVLRSKGGFQSSEMTELVRDIHADIEYNTTKIPKPKGFKGVVAEPSQKDLKKSLMTGCEKLAQDIINGIGSAGALQQMTKEATGTAKPLQKRGRVSNDACCKHLLK